MYTTHDAVRDIDFGYDETEMIQEELDLASQAADDFASHRFQMEEY